MCFEMRSYGFSSNALAGVCGATWLPRGRAVRQRDRELRAETKKYKDVQFKYYIVLIVVI